MYPVSNAVKALFDAEQVQVLRITGTDRNGATISITDANLLIGSFNVDRYSCNGQKLEIGTAIASELNLKLNNADGTYDSIIFEGAELFVEIGIADWTQQTPTVTYIPCGYFTPDEQPRKLTTITLKALDRMTRFDAVHPTLTPWTDNNGNVITDGNGNIIYFCAEFSFPCTIAQLVKQCAIRCQVPFTQSLSGLPNYNYTITALPVLQQAITFRNIIQWCAGIMGTCAYIDWNGELVFKWYSAASYTSTMAKRYASDLQENDITITGVKYTNTQNATIVSGTNDYALDMTGNYLAATGIAQILPAVKNKVNGFTYRPFSASVINAPYLWPMDVITFTDKDGNDHSCAVTNVNFGINSVTKLEGKGETDEINKGVVDTGITKEQGFLIEQAVEVTKQLDESLDQENIFNRLTDNGETQGLLLYNGKVYLNASYISTGTLVADFIKGGTLTLGGLNNADGVLQVLDANGNVIGKWDKNGINATAGTFSGNLNGATGTFSGEMSANGIKGGTLTLGGNNNTNGTITVKDANNNTIGAWSKDGITLNKGVIEGPSITIGGYNNANGRIIVQNRQGTQNGLWDYNNFTVDSNTLDINSQNGRIAFKQPTGSHEEYYYTELSDGGFYMHLYSSDGQDAGGVNINASSVGCGIYTDQLLISESENIYPYATFNIYGAEIRVPTNIYGNFTVTGTKNRRVSTDQYSDRLLYCYETPSPMFGDVGEGVIAEDGLCYITLDAVFAQTITTAQYQVFLQKYGDGDCWVKERKGGYFIVQGTPGLAFGWEIKAKQRDFDQKRLDKAEEPYKPETTDYGAEAAQYIDNLKKEREIA